MMGWNLYGGWRIGIRDIYNIYHYYAHMSGFDEEIKVGQVVQPGDILGSVGSTGYARRGHPVNFLRIFITACIKIMGTVNFHLIPILLFRNGNVWRKITIKFVLAIWCVSHF